MLLPFPQKFFVALRYVDTRPGDYFGDDESLLLSSLRRQARLGPASENKHMCANQGWFSSPARTKREKRIAPPSFGSRGFGPPLHDGDPLREEDDTTVLDRRSWDAWESLGSMDQLEAMRLFVRMLDTRSSTGQDDDSNSNSNSNERDARDRRDSDADPWEESEPLVEEWSRWEMEALERDLERVAGAVAGKRSSSSSSSSSSSTARKKKDAADAADPLAEAAAKRTAEGQGTSKPKHHQPPNHDPNGGGGAGGGGGTTRVARATFGNIGGALVPLPRPGHHAPWGGASSTTTTTTAAAAAPPQPSVASRPLSKSTGRDDRSPRDLAVDGCPGCRVLSNRVAALESEVFRLRSTIVHLTAGGAGAEVVDGLHAGIATGDKSSERVQQGRARWRWLSAIFDLIWGPDASGDITASNHHHRAGEADDNNNNNNNNKHAQHHSRRNDGHRHHHHHHHQTHHYANQEQSAETFSGDLAV